MRSIASFVLIALFGMSCLAGAERRDDATEEVSALYYQSLKEPDGVDALIASDAAYRREAVQRCLEDIARNAAKAAGEWADVHQQVNTEIQINGGSNQPGGSADGSLVMWSTSMLSSVRGTPWEQTEYAVLTEQVWQALAFLLPLHEWEATLATYHEILEEGNDDVLPWIICP